MTAHSLHVGTCLKPQCHSSTCAERNRSALLPSSHSRRTALIWSASSTLPKRNQPWCARSWPSWWRTARPWRRSWPSTGQCMGTSTLRSPWRRWGWGGLNELESRFWILHLHCQITTSERIAADLSVNEQGRETTKNKVTGDWFQIENCHSPDTSSESSLKKIKTHNFTFFFPSLNIAWELQNNTSWPF